MQKIKIRQTVPTMSSSFCKRRNPLQYIKTAQDAQQYTKQLFSNLHQFYNANGSYNIAKMFANYNGLADSVDKSYYTDQYWKASTDALLENKNSKFVIFGIETEYSSANDNKSLVHNANIQSIDIYPKIIDINRNYQSENRGNLKETQETLSFLQRPVNFSLVHNDESMKNSGKTKTNLFGSINCEMMQTVATLLNNPCIFKVFCEYSNDYAVLTNVFEAMKQGMETRQDKHCQLNIQGFIGDVMHMARLVDSSSDFLDLEDLHSRYIDVSDKIQDSASSENDDHDNVLLMVELYDRLRDKLLNTQSSFDSSRSNRDCSSNLFEIYQSYWKPFGTILAQMEQTGIKVRTKQYFTKRLKNARIEKKENEDKFLNWAKTNVDENAQYINLNSKDHLAHLFFNNQDLLELKVPITPQEYKDNVDKQSQKNVTFHENSRSKDCYKIVQIQGLGMEPITITKSGKRAAFDQNTIDILIKSHLQTHFKDKKALENAINALKSLQEANNISTQIQCFLEPLKDYICSKDGRIHASLNLNTETGRLSSRNPNLQNQPSIKDKFEIRKAFIAEKNNLLLVADYAQIELRILAYLSQCEYMINAFENGNDFHSQTAMSMYPQIEKLIKQGDVILDESEFSNNNNNTNNNNNITNKNQKFVKDVFPTERHRAKVINFGLIYGMSNYGLAIALGISKTEANQIIQSWYSKRNEVKLWQIKQMICALKTGKVSTVLGRTRILFPTIENINYNNNANGKRKGNQENINVNVGDFDAFVQYIENKIDINDINDIIDVDFGLLWKRFCIKNQNYIDDRSANVTIPQLNGILRKAINAPIQGSAADIVMKAMLDLNNNEELNNLGFKLLLQIHDEVILEGPKENICKAKEIVKHCMENVSIANKNNIKLVASVKSCQTWFDAK